MVLRLLCGAATRWFPTHTVPAVAIAGAPRRTLVVAATRATTHWHSEVGATSRCRTTQPPQTPLSRFLASHTKIRTFSSLNVPSTSKRPPQRPPPQPQTPVLATMFPITSTALTLALTIGILSATLYFYTEDEQHTQRTTSSQDSITRVNNPPATLLQQLRDIIATGFAYVVITFNICRRFCIIALLFGPLAALFPLWFFMEYPAMARNDVPRLWWINFLVHCLEFGGPTFTKLGQWASARSDLFPLYACEALTRLQADVSPHSFRYTRRVIEQEYGVPLEDVFESFNPVPIGVGCIAQVHEAVVRREVAEKEFGPTFNGTRRCAVKVLHPGVNSIYADLAILSLLGNIINRIPTFEWLSIPGEIKAFGTMMRQQLDMKYEGVCLQRFERNFIENPNVYFPIVFHDLTRRRVLVESFMEGIPLSKFLSAKFQPYNSILARVSWKMFLQMMVIDNFVHADLHPGNIVVTFRRPNTSGVSLSLREMVGIDTLSRLLSGKSDHISPTVDPSIYMSADKTRELSSLSPKQFHEVMKKSFGEGWEPVLLIFDAGMVSELSTLNLHNFMDLFGAVTSFDGKLCAKMLVERSRTPWTVINFDVFSNHMDEFLSSIKQQTLRLSKIQLGDILAEMFSMVRDHHIRLESDYTNMGVGLMLLEGTEKSLDASLDLIQMALPVIRKGATERSQSEYERLQNEDNELKKRLYVEYEYREKAREIYRHPWQFQAVWFDWGQYWAEHVYQLMTGLEPTVQKVPTNLTEFLKFTASLATNTIGPDQAVPSPEEETVRRRQELKRLVAGPAYVKLWLYYHVRPLLMLPDIISDIELFEQARIFFSE